MSFVNEPLLKSASKTKTRATKTRAIDMLGGPHQPYLLGPDGEKVILERVNKARAIEILEKLNTRNRRFKPSKIEAFTHDMQSGHWNFGTTISYAKDGALLDGQNRMAAIIASDTVQTFVVIDGLPTEAQMSMDTGSPRSFADVLDIRSKNGSDNVSSGMSSLIASSVAWCMRYERQIITTGGKPRAMTTNERDGKNISHHEMLAWLENNKGIRDVITWVKDLDALQRKGISKSMLIGLIYEAKGLEDEAKDFVRRYASGVGVTSEQDPALQLGRLLDNVHKKNNKTLSKVQYIGLLIKSFNYHARGETVAHLRFTYDGGNRRKIQNREKFPKILTLEELTK